MAEFLQLLWKWAKVGKTISQYLMKVHSIPQSFSWSKTFSFYKISYCITSFTTKISCFTWISQILTGMPTLFCIHWKNVKGSKMLTHFVYILHYVMAEKCRKPNMGQFSKFFALTFSLTFDILLFHQNPLRPNSASTNVCLTVKNMVGAQDIKHIDGWHLGYFRRRRGK